MDTEYRIIFRGATREGFRHEEVRAIAIRRLKVTERQLERMFSGQAVVLKKGLDETGGRTYLRQLQKLGLDAVLEQVGTPPAPIARPTPAHKADNWISDSSFADFERTQINLSRAEAVLNGSGPGIALAQVIPAPPPALEPPSSHLEFSASAARAPISLNGSFMCSHCGTLHQLEASIQIKAEGA